MADYQHSAGIDSFNFVLPKKALLKFLGRHGLQNKLRLTNRNANIRDFVAQKYKNQGADDPKHKYRVRFVPLKKNVANLSNCLIVFENTKLLHKIASERKKAKDYFVMASFAGLFQPSKDIDKAVYRLLRAFIKRFVVYSVDVAADFESQMSMGNRGKEFVKFMLEDYLTQSVISYRSTIYLNKLQGVYGLEKVLIYDKYKKANEFHRDCVPKAFKDWKRMEARFVLKKRWHHLLDEANGDDFAFVSRAIGFLDDLHYRLGLNLVTERYSLDFLSAQVRYFNDGRAKIDLKRKIPSAS